MEASKFRELVEGIVDVGNIFEEMKGRLSKNDRMLNAIIEERWSCSTSCKSQDVILNSLASYFAEEMKNKLGSKLTFEFGRSPGDISRARPNEMFGDDGLTNIDLSERNLNDSDCLKTNTKIGLGDDCSIINNVGISSDIGGCNIDDLEGFTTSFDLLLSNMSEMSSNRHGVLSHYGIVGPHIWHEKQLFMDHDGFARDTMLNDITDGEMVSIMGDTSISRGVDGVGGSDGWSRVSLEQSGNSMLLCYIPYVVGDKKLSDYELNVFNLIANCNKNLR
ncbi:uncharacterized protein LOC133778047 [Humulus lupulus]|uniref:uncharacterized protein LOC133778047 n=1 Tax=Humulus lupulus TaxID=3486 RepID=UPI002B401AC0|nr:uncharacterized protein LOC133778047 [Humulus lupulus]XP_062073849.1 uncharacterized protein LOC133778047 [Humulus lupulus]XP_062073850.1 uncharacterized protein LOC133778047 [Humulus lupulus]